MDTWLLVTAIGTILSVIGLLTLVQRYRHRKIRLTSLLAYIMGYVSLVSYACLSAFRPGIATGPVTLATLTPAFVAIVVLVHQHQKARKKRNNRAEQTS